MKRLNITLFAMLVAMISYAQTTSGVWNSTTSTYTNTQYGIRWKLIEEWDWEARPILSKSTILKVRNNDTRILVSLDVQSLGKEENQEIWDYLHLYESKEYYNMQKAEAQRAGMVFQYSQSIKSQLCGKYANKIKTDMTKHYPEHNTTMHAVKYMYQVVSNNKLYSLCVHGLSVREDELEIFENLVTKIVGGFKIDY